jgi:cyclic pyranopterin phosphate synthase
MAKTVQRSSTVAFWRIDVRTNEVQLQDRILMDSYSRKVDYLRMSVTDRCDFRCVYCMAEDMQFLPRQQILTLEEIFQLAERFVALGTRKIR